MFDPRPTPPDHLLLPSPPTPNGPLHLGHIAGPYLRMDLLRRSLLRRGASVSTILSLDVYESYVLLRAHEMQRDPIDVVTDNKRRIKDDLKALDIEIDVVADPSDPALAVAYQDAVTHALEGLRTLGVIERRSESMLYSSLYKRFVVGCWLIGACPSCGHDAGGYGCEMCGTHYRPEMIQDGRSRLDDPSVKRVTVQSLFLRLREPGRLLKYLERTGMPTDFVEQIDRQIRWYGSSVRVSVPGTWGIQPEQFLASDEVVYSGFAALPTLFFCGEIYSQLHNLGNPFLAGSSVRTICSFGFDNLVTRALASVGGALENPQWQAPSACLVNRFYLLEGKKFSTSRNHAIWASEVTKWSEDAADLVRRYLTETGPHRAETNFQLANFVASSHQFASRWNDAVTRCAIVMASQAQDATPSPSLEESLREALDHQDRALQPSSFQSDGCLEALDSWLELRGHLAKGLMYWWLKALALIAWPIVPNVATQVWAACGFNDQKLEERQYTVAGKYNEHINCLLKAPDVHMVR